MNELPDLPPLPGFSFLLVPASIALLIAFFALCMPRLHPAPPDKKSRLGGFTWWLLVALCLGGLGASVQLWREHGSAPAIYIFWSVICGIGAAGMWHSSHAAEEPPTSMPAGLKHIGRFFGDNCKKQRNKS